MSDTQRAAYEGSERIKSDMFGLIDRDNRNHQKKLRLILDALPALAGHDLLEVGCGDGLHAPEYARRARSYTGVDISASLVQTTTARLAGTGTARAVQMDATRLAYPPESFDAVVGTAVLHHMADPEAALREWLRVLRPAGRIVLMEPNYLFPKEILQTHVLPEEKHKVHMRPWRLSRTLSAVAEPAGRAYDLEPRIYTIPWPRALHGVYDHLDNLARRLPVVRWLGQMQRIQVREAPE